MPTDFPAAGIRHRSADVSLAPFKSGCLGGAVTVIYVIKASGYSGNQERLSKYLDHPGLPDFTGWSTCIGGRKDNNRLKSIDISV